MASCFVCLEDYKGRVKPVVCQYCPAHACGGCQQRYLLQTYEDPHCMTCKRGWSPEFMAASFTATFRGTALRLHRRKVLFEREKAVLPALQIYVEYKRTMQRLDPELHALTKEVGSEWSKEPYNADSIAFRWRKTYDEHYRLTRLIVAKRADIQVIKIKMEEEASMQGGPPALDRSADLRKGRYDMMEYKKQREETNRILQEIGPVYNEKKMRLTQIRNEYMITSAAYHDRGGPAVRERKEFIMKCGGDECRGFLSTSYKCGTCEKWTCQHCLVVIGTDKEAEHTCNPDTVESAKTIKSETRPCPKCGTRIFKIDGCFAENTPILMWNGQTKFSQDIVIGDELVGDDGQKRVVETTCSGEDEMYEVSQKRGMSYTVNSKHKLALKDNAMNIVEIIVDDYMALLAEEKNNLYGYRSEEAYFKRNCDSTPNKDWFKSSIEVKPVGKGTYYGWSISGNKRFVSEDMTVLRNCDQMWCVMDGCGTAFDWNSGHIVTGVVHNPHYYEWLRRNGGAAREVGDIPCGGMPTAIQIIRALNNIEIPNEMITTIMETFRNMQDLLHERLPGYPARMPQLIHKEDDVAYLMNELTEAEWKRKLEITEARFNRKKEIGQILQTLITAGSDMMNRLYERIRSIDTETNPDGFTGWLLDTAFPELEQLRTFGNESLRTLARRDKMAVPQLEENWKWKGVRALYRSK